jgi:hypothetical protein
MARFSGSGGGEGTPGPQGEQGTDGLDSLFLGTWNSVTEFLAVYQGGPVGLPDGDWWAFVKDNANPNKIYVVREDVNSATGWVIDDNEHFVLPAGADGESFSFRGAYGGAAIVYNLNDVVTYNGSSYICLSDNVTGSQPDSLVSWDIFVEKGADGADGASGTSGLETSTRYSPTFAATGLAFTGSGATYPTYNSYYVKAGKLVSFVIEVDLSTVTNFGTGQYKLQLPFTPQFGFNHFSGWIWADPNVDPDTGTGHTILNADTAGVTNVLDLHYLKQSGGANSPIREGLFLQGTPVTLTTISKIYINGTYIAAS